MLKELVLAASSSEFRRRVLVLGVRESERPQYFGGPDRDQVGLLCSSARPEVSPPGAAANKWLELRAITALIQKSSQQIGLRIRLQTRRFPVRADLASMPDAGAKFRRRPPSAERGFVPRAALRAPPAPSPSAPRARRTQTYSAAASSWGEGRRRRGRGQGRAGPTSSAGCTGRRFAPRVASRAPLDPSPRSVARTGR